MTLRLLLTAFFLALTPSSFAAEKNPENCGCSCCEGKKVCCCYPADETPAVDAAKKSVDDEVRHPVRGVIREVMADRSALLVKHDAIPGYMKAMTMLFQVEAPTLAAARKGQTIEATLVKREGKYWLEDVTVVTPQE